MPVIISKSKYLNGLQCHKLLWHHFNAKDKIPKPDEATQAKFDQGNEVGELVKRLFPDGVEPKAEFWEMQKFVDLTADFLPLRKPIFEAGFIGGGAFARVDILVPVGKDAWDLVEVKSSTEVKPVNLHDVSLQRHVCELSGLKIRKCWVYHINNQYVRQGDLEPERLFTKADVTNEILELQTEVGEKLDEMKKVIRKRSFPDIKVGKHCKDPYECPLMDICWSFLPEESVFDFTGLGKKADELMEAGILSITDVPNDYPLTDRQMLVVNAAKTGKKQIKKEEIREFLDTLVYPLYYLDFETAKLAIPPFDNIRPYQDFVFQFSLHIVKEAGVNPEHHMFLAEDAGDPRKQFIDGLKSLIGKSGSIVAYNDSFERGKLNALLTYFPEESEWVESLEPRFIDLMRPFRQRAYYDPSQRGSASQKSVLPALTSKTYDGMAISEGGEASREYVRVMYGDATTEERQKVLKELRDYCAMDTQGMIDIVNALVKLV